jgi:hypothetical protein
MTWSGAEALVAVISQPGTNQTAWQRNLASAGHLVNEIEWV